MPLGFAGMAFRGAKAAPPRGLRIAAWVIGALVIPFAISRVMGKPFLVPPDGSVLFAGKIGWLAWPGSLLLVAAFLLGTPVFVVMAGFALLLFFLAGTPVASVPAATFPPVDKPPMPAIP